MKNHSVHTYLVALACWLFASSCTSYVRVARIAPADAALPGVKTLAVGQFEGPDGTGLNYSFLRELRKSNRFEVVDRDIALAVQKAVDPAETNSATLQQGSPEAALPSTMAVSGAVLAADYQERTNLVENTCSRKGRDGKSESYKCYYRERRGQARYQANLRVLDTTTGKLVYSRAVGQSREKSTTASGRGGNPPSIDRAALLEECREEVALRLVNLLVPHQVHEWVKLVEDSELPGLEQGNDRGKAGQWEKALVAYRQALHHAQSTPGLEQDTVGKAHYAMGLGLAMTGDFGEALTHIAQAIELNPDGDWNSLLQKVTTWQQDAQRVEEQLGEPQPPVLANAQT